MTVCWLKIICEAFGMKADTHVVHYVLKTQFQHRQQWFVRTQLWKIHRSTHILYKHWLWSVTCPEQDICVVQQI